MEPPIACTLSPGQYADRTGEPAALAAWALAIRMSAAEKLLGAGALIMALSCALLPLAGAALGGGLIAGAGTVPLIVGFVVLAAVVYAVTRRRKAAGRC